MTLRDIVDLVDGLDLPGISIDTEIHFIDIDFDGDSGADLNIYLDDSERLIIRPL